MLDVVRLINLVDITIFTQSFIFGLIFILFNKKNKSTIFLGLFLLTFSFDGCKDLLEEIFVAPVPFNYELLPTIFIFLALPLFYMYARQVSILKDAKQNYWVLIPGIIEFVVLFALFLMNIDYLESLFFALYFLIGIAFNVYVAIKIIRFAKKHLKLVEDQYASVSGLQLFWVKQYAIALLSYLGFSFLMIGFESPYVDLLVSIIDLALVYWVIYKGFQQESVVPLIITDESQEETSKEQMANNDPEDLEEMNQIVQDLDAYLKEYKFFRQKDLTIVDVSNGIDVSSKKVSRAINLVRKVNFNVYINSLRIEEAVLYLKDRNYDGFSVEGIGLEAGFKSKSAFYNAFKKEKNCTPLELRKQILAQNSSEC